MKTYSEFLFEAKQAKPSKEVMNTISKNYERKYKGAKLDTSIDSSGDIRLNNIWLPHEHRNKGIGSRIMKGLSNYADRQNKKITLSQAPERGKKAKLEKFYKSHGFVSNRGKNRDFSTKDTHIRNPIFNK